MTVTARCAENWMHGDELCWGLSCLPGKHILFTRSFLLRISSLWVARAEESSQYASLFSVCGLSGNSTAVVIFVYCLYLWIYGLFNIYLLYYISRIYHIYRYISLYIFSYIILNFSWWTFLVKCSGLQWVTSSINCPWGRHHHQSSSAFVNKSIARLITYNITVGSTLPKMFTCISMCILYCTRIYT